MGEAAKNVATWPIALSLGMLQGSGFMKNYEYDFKLKYLK